MTIPVDIYRELRYTYCILRWNRELTADPIADKVMKLGEKIRYLREVEGSLRGLDRAMSQQELVRAIEARDRLEAEPELPLADRKRRAAPPDQHHAADSGAVFQGASRLPGGRSRRATRPELQSELRNVEDKLDLWLVAGAERFRRDPELKQALLTLARHEHYAGVPAAAGGDPGDAGTGAAAG